jgi:hypothetical protein
MIAKWLERWAERVTVGLEVRPDGLTQLAVDLDGSEGAKREAATGGNVRYLGMDELGASLKKRIMLLRKGESPQSLKLGEECVQPYCEQNLMLLYRQLCEAANTRDQSRKSASDNAQISSGIGAIHHYISGLPFKQPGSAKELTSKERQEIATFGRIATRDESGFSQLHGYAIETWTLLDESITGLRMRRAADAPGGRFSHTQLIGLRPSDSRSFMLGTVRWLLSTHELDLTAGVRLMPGVPQAVAVKPTGINALSEKYVPALSLPEVPALHAPATLILPNGWFRPKRVVEVWRDAPQQVLLTGIVERGSDFERVTFEPI